MEVVKYELLSDSLETQLNSILIIASTAVRGAATLAVYL